MNWKFILCHGRLGHFRLLQGPPAIFNFKYKISTEHIPKQGYCVTTIVLKIITSNVRCKRDYIGSKVYENCQLN